MNVNDVVAEKIAAAARRAEETKRRRAALNAARQRGLAHRHAAKLRRQANRGDSPTVASSRVDIDTTPESNRGDIDTVADDDVVVEVTEAEFAAAARAALARLGLTYAELQDQARRRDFTSAQAHSLWISIGDTVRPELLEKQ
ncbi:hypothetical protein ACIRU8_10250 [Streptomyces sp. NPDC101175]|uniref:hypothetical protein n=1 Tax=Streptomyces sp. NPDC101175 TaxID=3366123 RepID=UPI00383559C6